MKEGRGTKRESDSEVVPGGSLSRGVQAMTFHVMLHNILIVSTYICSLLDHRLQRNHAGGNAHLLSASASTPKYS